MNRSFLVGGCCGPAGCTCAWAAAPEGRGGFALGSGAALLAAGLLGEAALVGAGLRRGWRPHSFIAAGTACRADLVFCCHVFLMDHCKQVVLRISGMTP